MSGSWSWRGSGQPHGNARLTAHDVAEIRTYQGRFSAREVSEMLSIGKSTVLDIWRGKTWREL